MAIAAVTQICSTSNIARNSRICVDVIERAARAGASFVCLPEASDYICPPGEGSALLLKSREQREFVESIHAAARQAKVWVSIGIHEKSDDGRAYNTQLLLDDGGTLVQSYRKLHLYDVDVKPDGPQILESKTTKPGVELLPPVQTSIGRVGLQTCYDLRFPPPWHALRRVGAEVLTCPSAFFIRTGQAHWEPLLRARAIETQCYVLAAAQTGTHYSGQGDRPGRSSYGHAIIVDAWGTVLAQASESTETETGSFVTAEIDLAWLAKIRKEMPVLEQRRLDVYPEL